MDIDGKNIRLVLNEDRSTSMDEDGNFIGFNYQSKYSEVFI